MILDDILARTRADLEARDEGAARWPTLARAWRAAPAAKPRSLMAGAAAAGRHRAASPSSSGGRRRRAGSTRRPSLSETVSAYAAGGASALSVLTDGPFFAGGLDDLQQARAPCSLPVLAQGLHRRRLPAGRGASPPGADAALLIVAALDDATLAELLRHGRGARASTSWSRAHDEDEVARAVAAGARDHRHQQPRPADLHRRSRPGGPAAAVDPRRIAIVVAESGIRNAADVARLRDAGVDAILVGETLMRAPDPAAALRELLAG